MTFDFRRVVARSLLQLTAAALITTTVMTTTGCGEDCDVTSGLFEPYRAAVLDPETFDQWVDDHPGYFTQARISCLAEKEQQAYQREIDLLRQCDRHFAGDAEGLDFCRSSVESPETFTAFWLAVLHAASGEGSFLDTGVGQQLYLFKQDDPAFYVSMFEELFTQMGSEMEQAFECKRCRKQWYDIF